MESQHYGTLSVVASRALAYAVLLATLTGIAVAEGADTVISSCEDSSLFSAGRTPEHPRHDFDAWDLRVFDGAAVAGASLRWHLRPSSEAQDYARLTWAHPLLEPLTGISLWVRNPNNHQLRLGIELVDADGIAYRSPGIDLADGLDWRQLDFPLSELEATADDPYPPLTFPVLRFSIWIEGLEVNRPHTIYLDEITASALEKRELHVQQLRMQTALAPGETMTVRAVLSERANAAEAALVAEMTTEAGGLVASAPLLIADAAEPSASLRVPQWLPSGRYEVRLRSDAVALAGPGASPVAVVIGGARRAAAGLALSLDFDGPTFLIGEREAPAEIEELRSAPVGLVDPSPRLIALSAATDSHPFGWAPPVLEGDDGPDFRLLDRRITAALGAFPESLIVLQVFLDSSAQWDAENASELQQFGGSTVAPPHLFATRRTRPDILSPRWQEHSLSRLRALISYVEQAPWGDRVAAYELQAGDLGAWRPWGASVGAGDDATELRQRLFRDWMRDHYADANELRGSWLGRRRGFGSPGMTFDAVKMPPPLEDAREPSLYDPAIDQPMIDLHHFRAEAPAAFLLRAARAVQEEAGPSVLVGAPYGHILSQARAMDWSWPHLALTEVLESDAFDFLTGPLHRPDDTAAPSSVTASALSAGVAYLERMPGERPEQRARLIYRGPPAALLAANARGEGIIEVIDDVSARYLSVEGNLPRELLTRSISGDMPHRIHLTRDLTGGDPPRAQIYVFRNLFVISPQDGRALARNTARDGALLVWVYAPGAISRHLITGRTMEYLTGIKLSHLARSGPLRVEPTDRSLRPFGVSGHVSPWFFSADERAEWLGTLAGTQSEFCGLALRSFPHCKSVFSAAPPSEEMLRHLARITRTPLPDPVAGD